MRVRRWLAAAVLFGASLLPILPNPPLQTGTYLQCVLTDSAVIARIDASPRQLEVEVRSGERVVATVREGSPRRRHALQVTGLAPGTAYGFALRDARGVAVDEGRFTTAPADDAAPVGFCAVGDSGHVPWWGWLQDSPLFYLPARWSWLPCSGDVAAIGARMSERHPALWFHVGDVVYPWGENRHYGVAFFRPFAEVMRHAPVYAVAGNHDAETDAGRPLFANLVLPTNPVTGDERLWSFRHGAVRFLGLDLLQELHPGHPTLRFAERELAAAEEPWIVVIGHYPPFSASRQGDRQDLIEHLWPLLVRYGADLMLCGNDHNYQRFGEAPEPVVVVTGGGGKSLYELKEHPRLREALSVFEFVDVRIERAVLTLRVIGEAGEELKQMVIDKAALVRDGRLVLDPSSPRHRRIRALFP